MRRRTGALRKDMTKYVFVTGGVVSSLGKGIASASLAAILESRGLKVTLIKLDPYIPVTNAPAPLPALAAGLGIHPEAPVIIVPGRSGYVGGDITADVIASGMHRRKELALLIDVGTNGEVVLGNDQWLVGCSCSAGPAFEGGEVRFGMRAPGAGILEFEIERVQKRRDQPLREQALIPKAGPSSDWSLQPDSVKLDSLVIAYQQRRGEYVPGPCTHRPSSHGSWGYPKSPSISA